MEQTADNLARSSRVLFVDDEPNLLDAIRRQFRRRAEVLTATSAAQGLEIVRHRGPIAVVVTDMRMPEIGGAQFLAHVRDLSPDTVRIVLSGQADLQETIDAVNDGRIFRFVVKPCAPEVLWEAVAAGMQLYRMLTAGRDLMPHAP